MEASLVAQLVKNLQCRRPWFDSWVGKIPWKRDRLPIPVFLDFGLPRWLRQWGIRLQCRRFGFNPWVGRISWRRTWQPTLVFLPEESPSTEEPGGLRPMGPQSQTRLGGWAHSTGISESKSLISLLSYFGLSVQRWQKFLCILKAQYCYYVSSSVGSSPSGKITSQKQAQKGQRGLFNSNWLFGLLNSNFDF